MIIAKFYSEAFSPTWINAGGKARNDLVDADVVRSCEDVVIYHQIVTEGVKIVTTKNNDMDVRSVFLTKIH